MLTFPARRALGEGDYNDVTEHLDRLASLPAMATASGTKGYDSVGVGTLNRAVATMDMKADVPDYAVIADADAAPPRPHTNVTFTRTDGAVGTADYNAVVTGTLQL